MSSRYLGITPLKISTEVSFDPKLGHQTHEVYAGPAASLLALQATYESLGFTTKITQAAGKSYLDVIVPVSDSTSDYYDLETDFHEESIWTNPRFKDWAAKAFLDGLLFQSGRLQALVGLGYWTDDEIPQMTVDDILAFWRRECEAAQKGRTLNVGGEETSVDHPTAADTAAGRVARIDGPLDFNSSMVRRFEIYEKKIYRMLLGDELNYQTTRQTLTRLRTIWISNSAQAVAEAEPLIYTTTNLVTVFGIPASVAARLPADPHTPDDHRWGWKQIRNTSRYEWSGRVVETMSWTFAAWNTMTYQFYGDPAIALP